jgi:hypothetical protein
MKRCLFLIAYTLLSFAGSSHSAESIYPTIRLSEVPNAVLLMYKREEPNFTNFSHCATAWDSTTDGEKIAFKCSVFIKMSAEGERRAMHYCEEIREKKKITARCRLIVAP